MVEKRFALSGSSSVSESETEEAPERAKRFSTIPFPSLSDVGRRHSVYFKYEIRRRSGAAGLLFQLTLLRHLSLQKKEEGEENTTCRDRCAQSLVRQSCSRNNVVEPVGNFSSPRHNLRTRLGEGVNRTFFILRIFLLSTTICLTKLQKTISPSRSGSKRRRSTSTCTSIQNNFAGRRQVVLLK